MGVVAQIIQQDSTKRNVDTVSINPGLMRQTNISKGIPKALLFAVIEVHKNILNKQKPGVTSELRKSQHALPLTSLAVLSVIDLIESNPLQTGNTPQQQPFWQSFIL